MPCKFALPNKWIVVPYVFVTNCRVLVCLFNSETFLFNMGKTSFAMMIAQIKACTSLLVSELIECKAK